MQKPDANGFVSINWPSRSIPHGGIFHTKIAETTKARQEFLRVLLDESKLTIAQRRKSAYKLREEEGPKADVRPQVEIPMVRPRTSRRRSLSAIRESGVFEMDPYRPLKRGEDREKMKEKLAHSMLYGDTSDQPQLPPEPKPAAKPGPKLPTNKERWNELVTQIRERTDWLAEMEYLGEADPHREIVKDQIAERMRALDVLGIDSNCSSARSTATGFSTLRSREIVQKTARSINEGILKSDHSNRTTNNRENRKSVNSSVRSCNKEENVSSYGQLSPLQYSARRRV